MITIQAVTVCLTLALLPATLANPVVSATVAYSSLLEDAKCGQQAEVLIAVDDTVRLSSNYLIDSNGSLPENCVISWRIDVKTEGLENYGLQVEGIVELKDLEKDNRCSSSHVLITDRDDKGDITAVTQKVCGTKRVSYVTYQDTVTVYMRVSPTGAQGRGFTFTFRPIYACGGVIEGPIGTVTSIQTPRFGKPYPVDLFCAWNIKAPPESWIDLQCDNFSLPKRKQSGTCGDYLMVQNDGDIKHYCGSELLGEEQRLRVPNNESLLFFRSAGKYNTAKGFVCDVRFVAAN